MHMGYAFLGIAAYSVLGLGGVVLLMVAHGLRWRCCSSSRRACIIAAHHVRFGGHGRARAAGAGARALFVAGTFASIGLPGFGNFWGELAIFVALWKFSHVFTVIAWRGW